MKLLQRTKCVLFMILNYRSSALRMIIDSIVFSVLSDRLLS